MIFHKIHIRAVNGEDFKIALRDYKNVCNTKLISNPVFIIDNARIHHYRGIFYDEEFSNYEIMYLPAYSPFLNPIENIFSVWKISVIRGAAKNESELRNLISINYENIDNSNCGSFFRKMLSYLNKCVQK